MPEILPEDQFAFSFSRADLQEAVQRDLPKSGTATVTQSWVDPDTGEERFQDTEINYESHKDFWSQYFQFSREVLDDGMDATGKGSDELSIQVHSIFV